MSEEVLRLAMTLGKVEESEGLRALCELSVAELIGRLRPGVTAGECGGAFTLAAAWMALAALAEAGDNGVTSFTAGDVSIHKEAGGGRSRELRQRAGEIMKPYLRDGGFDFRSVRYG